MSQDIRYAIHFMIGQAPFFIHHSSEVISRLCIFLEECHQRGIFPHWHHITTADTHQSCFRMFIHQPDTGGYILLARLKHTPQYTDKTVHEPFYIGRTEHVCPVFCTHLHHSILLVQLDG